MYSSLVQSNDTQYAVYHSVHDNFDWMSKYGDPDFSYHLATAAVWGTTALLLATTPLPPVDLTYYSDWAEQAAKQFSKREILEERKITLSESCTSAEARTSKFMEMNHYKFRSRHQPSFLARENERSF